VVVAVVSTIFMMVIWFQGTPFYGVVAPPAVEVAQAFLPEEGVLPPVPLVPDDWGPIRRVGYENLPDGDYQLADYRVPKTSYTEFERILSGIQQELDHRSALWKSGDTSHGLPNPKGELVIEQWQENGLKRIDLKITWDKITPVDTGLYDRVIYLHKDTIYK